MPDLTNYRLFDRDNYRQTGLEKLRDELREAADDVHDDFNPIGGASRWYMHDGIELAVEQTDMDGEIVCITVWAAAHLADEFGLDVELAADVVRRAWYRGAEFGLEEARRQLEEGFDIDSGAFVNLARVEEGPGWNALAAKWGADTPEFRAMHCNMVLTAYAVLQRPELHHVRDQYGTRSPYPLHETPVLPSPLQEDIWQVRLDAVFDKYVELPDGPDGRAVATFTREMVGDGRSSEIADAMRYKGCFIDDQGPVEGADQYRFISKGRAHHMKTTTNDDAI